jgi:hypothetical protein
VLLSRNVGAVDDVPQGLAVDGDNSVWVGTYNGRQLFQIDAESGEILNTYDVSVRVSGLAADADGIVWIADSSGFLGAFDPSQRRQVPGSPWAIPSCSKPSGIGLDADGHVWLGNGACNNIAEFDPTSHTFQTFAPPDDAFATVRGIGADDTGAVWAVAADSDALGRYDSAAGTWQVFDTCNNPTGVGITGAGTIWIPCFTGPVEYFDEAGSPQGTLTAGTNPFSYSDMTGYQLRTFTARQGTWAVDFDCGHPACTFDELSWDADVAPRTDVRVRAKSSVDGSTWSAYAGYFDSGPADLSALPAGRYLQIEVQLIARGRDLSPVVHSIELDWQRP